MQSKQKLRRCNPLPNIVEEVQDWVHTNKQLRLSPWQLLKRHEVDKVPKGGSRGAPERTCAVKSMRSNVDAEFTEIDAEASMCRLETSSSTSTLSLESLDSDAASEDTCSTCTEDLCMRSCWSSLDLMSSVVESAATCNPVADLQSLEHRCADANPDWHGPLVAQIDVDIPRGGVPLSATQKDAVKRVLLCASVDYPRLCGYTQGESWVVQAVVLQAEREAGDALGSYKAVILDAWWAYEEILGLAGFQEHFFGAAMAVSLSEQLQTEFEGMVRLFRPAAVEKWQNDSNLNRFSVSQHLQQWRLQGFLGLFLGLLDPRYPEVGDLLAIIRKSGNFIKPCLAMLLVLMDFDPSCFSIVGESDTLRDNIAAAAALPEGSEGSFSYRKFVENVRRLLDAKSTPNKSAYVQWQDDEVGQKKAVAWPGLNTWAERVMFAARNQKV